MINQAMEKELRKVKENTLYFPDNFQINHYDYSKQSIMIAVKGMDSSISSFSNITVDKIRGIPFATITIKRS